MEIILITAGNSFVGQHFIKHLQSDGPKTLREIRVLDEKPFQKMLDYDIRIPIKSYVGTVFDSSRLNQALTNADTVCHLWELKDTSMLPDKNSMNRINIDGTKAMVEACKNIKRFLLLSSSDIMLNNQVACDANVSEIWAIPDGKWAYPDYCYSKYEAEKILFSRDFQSMAVRLGPMYGELDDQEWGFGTQMKLGKRFNGTIPVLGDRHGTIRHTYIGNAAYGMVKVLDKMISDPTATKEAIFLLDDTPLIDFYDLLEPISDARKYRLVTLPIWFMIFFVPYWILDKLAHWTEPVYCFGLKGFLSKLPSARILYNYCYNYITFNNFKAAMYIGYKPLYEHDIVLQKCKKYYAHTDF